MVVLKKSEKISIIFTIVLILTVYICGLYVFQSDGTYNITSNTNNDRFFSMDDSYYVNHFYSLILDNTGRIVKHPLLSAFAHYATQLQHITLGEISISSHYLLIVLGQIIICLIGLVFLFRILKEHYHLPTNITNLLVTLYAFSSATMIYTFIAESYIFSGTILIISYWCVLNDKSKSLIVLGILAGGVTITNFTIWAIIIMFLNRTFLNKIKLILISGLGLLGVICLLPIRQVFYSEFFKVFIGSPQNYSNHFSLFKALKMGFYSIFGSTYFYIDTVKQSPFGQYKGNAISFIPSSNLLISIIMCVWILGIIIACIRGIQSKDKLLIAPMLVLIFNIALHVGVQYGLNEAFLYSLHHSFAQILIVAYLMKYTSAPALKKVVYSLTGLYLVIMVGVNVFGGIELIKYINH